MQQFKKTRPNDWCDNNQCMLHKKTVKKTHFTLLVHSRFKILNISMSRKGTFAEP